MVCLLIAEAGYRRLEVQYGSDDQDFSTCTKKKQKKMPRQGTDLFFLGFLKPQKLEIRDINHLLPTKNSSIAQPFVLFRLL